MTSFFDKSKHIYKSQEAFVKLVLEDIFNRHLVLWHPHVEKVKFDPDFLVLDEQNNYKYLVMVTHSGPQNANQMKMWRDLHELFIFKRKFPSMKVIRLLFGSAISMYWKSALDSIVDSNIVLDEIEDGKYLSQYLEALVSDDMRFAGFDKFYEELKKNLLDKDNILLKAFEHLSEVIKYQLSITKPLSKFKYPPNALVTTFSPSSVRRGVTFAALAGKQVFLKDSSSWVGPFKTEGLFGDYVADEYIDVFKNTFDILGKTFFEKLTAQASGILSAHIKRASNIELILNTAEHGITLFSNGRFTDLNSLEEEMFKKAEITGGNSLWLGLRYIVKTVHGDGYGNSWLLKESGGLGDTGSLYRLADVFSGKKLIENPGILHTLTKKAMECLDFLGRSPKQSDIFKKILNEEAVKSRHLEPLLWIIEELSNFRGQKVRLPTFIDQTGKVGTITGYKVDNTFYYWKSAYAGHRDKTKELCARGMALYLSERPPKNRVLLLDGEFTGSDLKDLKSSGWTAIFSLSRLKEFQGFIRENH
ncbi:MAG: hypothetical protein JXR95_10310 [Deltaproteobacteria bacterium]|nr:hypothetical protein [Deltaproteobacteria bacterium]